MASEFRVLREARQGGHPEAGEGAVEQHSAEQCSEEHPERQRRRTERSRITLRVALIDHRTLMRQSISEMLERSIGNTRVLQASSAAELIEKYDRASADFRMIIIRISGSEVHERDFRENVALLKSEFGDAPIIVLADETDTAIVAEALRKGIRGYVPTSLELAVAIEALKLVQAGGTFIPACALPGLLQDGSGEAGEPESVIIGAVAPPVRVPQGTPITIANGVPVEVADEAPGEGARGGAGNSLTPRQAAVLELLRLGKPNKAIARELKMQECTVKVHVRQIMKKLNAKNRTEAALKAADRAVSGAGC